MESGAEWFGAIAEGFAALAALGALWFAVVAARHTKALLATESDRDVVAQEMRESAQAEGISAWTAAHLMEDDSLSYGIVLRNDSSGVVYDVSVHVKGKGGADLQPVSLLLLPPGEFYIAEPDFNLVAKTWTMPRSTEAIGGEVQPVARAKERGIVELCFRDSANRRWKRERSGELQDVK